MKTIKTLAAGILIVLSGTTFAASNLSRNGDENLKALPGLKPVSVASSNDFDVNEIEALKNVESGYSLPEIDFSTPQDFDVVDIEGLKNISTVSLPVFYLGSAADINQQEIEALKAVAN